MLYIKLIQVERYAKNTAPCQEWGKMFETIQSDAADVRTRSLIPDLTFIGNKKSRGYLFRFGLMEIQKEDLIKLQKNFSRYPDLVAGHACFFPADDVLSVILLFFDFRPYILIIGRIPQVFVIIPHIMTRILLRVIRIPTVIITSPDSMPFMTLTAALTLVSFTSAHPFYLRPLVSL
jgi:hypothetical protein